MPFRYEDIKDRFYENLPEENFDERLDELENIKIVANNFHSDIDAWAINPYGYGVSLSPDSNGNQGFSISPQFNIGDIITSVDLWISTIDCNNNILQFNLLEVRANDGVFDPAVLQQTGITLDNNGYRKYTVQISVPHTVTEGDTYSIFCQASTDNQLDAFISVSCAVITVQRA